MLAIDASYQALQKALIEARHAAGLTQLEVANRLSKPQSFMSKLEQGERRLDVIEFVEVCRALNADPVAVLNKIIGRK
ncbi:helix-turn-helix domain-containing protein [Achromobacter xylosoxidans]|uniref:helix-turn-helix domain-containing protein n=1 Tax=Alcaligenes xylosoxydans xylosoxydans TaxID=85698 RepID=UPI0009EBF994|nr:helix-turn-helix transcriptional regulator [Achromobacter xylosoxidans]